MIIVEFVCSFLQTGELAQNNGMENCCHIKVIRIVMYSECNCLEELDLAYIEHFHKKNPKLCQKYEEKKRKK